jgi:hypothetical protein
MMREKSSSNAEPQAPGCAQRRRVGGARREASERVSLRASAFETDGWTLNVSRGGIRAIVETPLSEGAEYDLVVGDAAVTKARRARVVWLRDESDGQIVGLEYLDDEAMPARDI